MSGLMKMDMTMVTPPPSATDRRFLRIVPILVINIDWVMKMMRSKVAWIAYWESRGKMMKRYEIVIHLGCSDGYESGEEKW